MHSQRLAKCSQKWSQLKSLIFSFFQLDFQLQSEDGGDIDTFIPNGEWALLGESDKFIIIKILAFCGLACQLLLI